MYTKFRDLTRDWTQVACLAVSHSNHYTRMFPVLVWGYNWIQFIFGWFCPICLILLIFSLWKKLIEIDTVCYLGKQVNINKKQEFTLNVFVSNDMSFFAYFLNLLENWSAMIKVLNTSWVSVTIEIYCDALAPICKHHDRVFHNYTTLAIMPLLASEVLLRENKKIW